MHTYILPEKKTLWLPFSLTSKEAHTFSAPQIYVFLLV